MRDNSSCADIFLRPRDCGRVTLGDRFVVRRRRQSCPICRTYRQVLQEALGGCKLLFGSPVDPPSQIKKLQKPREVLAAPGVTREGKLGQTAVRCNRVKPEGEPTRLV